MTDGLVDLSSESEGVEVVQTDEKLLAQTETVRQAQRSVDEDEDYVVPEHLLKLYQATAEDLDDHGRALVRQVLRRNADIFASSSTDLGSTNVATHSIDTGDSKPIKQAPRRVAIHRQDHVKREVETMLAKNIIEPADGPWSSPIVLAKRKNGSLRFCIDKTEAQ